MKTITLYTKAGCTLCNHVKDYLSERMSAHPHVLNEIDITEDHDTFARYRFSIPVVEIGETTLKAPITNKEMEKALKALK